MDREPHAGPRPVSITGLNACCLESLEVYRTHGGSEESGTVISCPFDEQLAVVRDGVWQWLGLGELRDGEGPVRQLTLQGAVPTDQEKGGLRAD